MLATRRHPVSIPVLLRAQSLFASGASVHEVYAALGSAMAETRAQAPTDERPDDEPRSDHILAALEQLREMLRTHAAPQPDETQAAVPRIVARIDALEATLAARPAESAPADLVERIVARIDALEAALAERIDALTSETAALPAQAAEAMAAALVGSGGGLGGEGDEWSATDALAAVVALRMLQIVERQLSRLDALTETRPEAPVSTGHRLIARLRGKRAAEPAREAPATAPVETLDRDEIVRQMEDTLAHINDLLGRGVNRSRER